MSGAQPIKRGGPVRSFGELVAGVKPPKQIRSGQPVWRNSYYEGQVEDRLWRPIANGTKRGARRRIGAIVKAARTMERRTRRERQVVHPGTRNGLLGEIGLAVLEVLYEIVDYSTGRLEPAIATVAERVGHSYAAVHAALRRLRSAGFLHWIRRSRPTKNQGEAGPQVEQITNAYALTLPKPLEDLVRHLLGKAPVPDDVGWHRTERKREWDEMLAGLSAAQFMTDHWSGDQLAGESLKRIARILDERESSRAVETGGV